MSQLGYIIISAPTTVEFSFLWLARCDLELSSGQFSLRDPVIGTDSFSHALKTLLFSTYKRWLMYVVVMEADWTYALNE